MHRHCFLVPRAINSTYITYLTPPHWHDSRIWFVSCPGGVGGVLVNLPHCIKRLTRISSTCLVHTSQHALIDTAKLVTFPWLNDSHSRCAAAGPAFQSSSSPVWNDDVWRNNWDWILIRRLSAALRHLAVIASTVALFPYESSWWSNDREGNLAVRCVICRHSADSNTPAHTEALLEEWNCADTSTTPPPPHLFWWFLSFVLLTVWVLRCWLRSDGEFECAEMGRI